MPGLLASTVSPAASAAASADWCAALLDLVLRQVYLSSVVFLVVLVLSWLLRGRWPALHCCLWSLVLLRLVLPPGLWHPLGAGNLAAHLPFLERLGITTEARPGQDSVPSGLLSPGVIAPVTQGTARISDHSNLLVGLWLTVAALLVLRSTRQLQEYRRVLREARPVTDLHLLAALAEWRQRLGIRRAVRLVSSLEAAPPFTLGCLRPVIFLPAALTCSDASVVEAVLAHELVHVARWDSLTVRLQRLLQAVYHFHPLLWIASARLDREREQACDAVVLSYGTISPRSYAAAILDVLQLETGTAAAPAFVSRSSARISGRIRSIIAGRNLSRLHTAVMLLTTLLLGAFLLPLAAGPQSPGEPIAESLSDEEVVAEQPPEAATALQLQSPLPGSTVSWGYRQGRDPFTGKVRQHSGIDLVAKLGTPVLAAAGGTVELATTSWEQGISWGHVVIVDHGDGIKTVYAHLGELLVETGQTVEAGDTLANIGMSGRTTGPHLHFEVWENGQHYDPSHYVDEW